MKHRRFYCSPISRPQVELTGPEAHHAVGVLRHREGDRIELFDGAGTQALAQIRAIRPGSVLLDVLESRTAPPPAAGRIILAASLAQGERFDWLIEKCTELGVDRIYPLRFARTIKQGRRPNTQQRYRQRAIAAAKQSRRLFVPAVDPPGEFAGVLAGLRDEFPAGRILLASPAGRARAPWQDPPATGVDQIAFVGPEGGLTDDEEGLLEAAGAVPIRLTDTILRIETAAVALVALLCGNRDAGDR
ncbi:MAG: 16S rRNA (uracil(1498)-N(3))-methyltransferase [Sedimentisphaerales bacterium]|nr:16S rRNA (uracil(1498)-N(3))-methyltransferase [Sedimentisphaerales bacterium]